MAESCPKRGIAFWRFRAPGSKLSWFQASHQADKKGPMAGVPFDGTDPKFEDLYHKKAAPGDKEWLTTDAGNQQEWLNSIKELIDNYHPDLLYSDSNFPFGDVGREMVSHFYNEDIKKNGGKLEAVYNCKQPSQGMWVEDLERGVKDTINKFPWQTDTSIGDWYYRTGQKYKSATEIVCMLVDIVSKNGNLLINVVQTPEGDLEQDMLKILGGIGVWTAANGEGIYGTRPWKLYGEKPANAKVVKAGNFNEEKVKYSASDIRFTQKGDILYAFCLGTPVTNVVIKSLGTNSKFADKAVESVTMLGSSEKLNWKQEPAGLVITKPAKLPDWQVITFKVAFKK